MPKDENLPYLAANRIHAPSYGSFESALSFYHLIPEGVFSITSAMLKTNQFTTFLGREKRINIFFFAVVIVVFPISGFCQHAKEIKRFKVETARQGVAVDRDHFYVINNSSITKHRKADGGEVARWDGKAEGIIHLNSGTIISGKLYCANSNFPHQPMAGSIEIFDPETLKHIGTHSFGIGNGSVTWIDERDGFWWIGFAHYSGKYAADGRDTRWTMLAKYTKDWAQVEAWIYPENIVEKFMPMSNSGGSWGNNGYLYCTGHDKEELYVMKLPKSGYTLEHVTTIPVTIHGQGIAIDRTVKNKLIIYGISERKESSVVVNEIEWDE